MKKIKIIVIAIAAAVVLLAAAAAGCILYMGTPTTGEKIAAYDKPCRALLVIDIQEGLTGASSKMEMYRAEDITPAIATVNGLINTAAGKKLIIIYIRQQFEGIIGVFAKAYGNDALIKGSPGEQVDRRIAIRSDYNLSKPRGDAFSNPELSALLVRNRVNELYLTGLDAEHCVHNTAKGALNRGYRVNIVTDAILLSAKEKWNSLMEEYKKEGIVLLTSKDL